MFAYKRVTLWWESHPNWARHQDLRRKTPGGAIKTWPGKTRGGDIKTWVGKTRIGAIKTLAGKTGEGAIKIRWFAIKTWAVRLVEETVEFIDLQNEILSFLLKLKIFLILF